MIHEMKLHPKYYDFILNGTKRIEIRLNDEKRSQINLGDKIKFLKEPDLENSFEGEVIGLLRYNSFEEMFEDYSISILADKSMAKDELIKALEEFYSKEKQQKYGVLGIRIKLKDWFKNYFMLFYSKKRSEVYVKTKFIRSKKKN